MTDLVLDGAVNFDTYGALAARLEEGLQAAALTVDWQQVESVDSSAITLMFHAAREARARGVEVRHRNLPAALDALAELYGVDDFLQRP